MHYSVKNMYLALLGLFYLVKSNIGGMTSDKGLAEIAFTEQGWNMVVFKVGYEPILVRTVLLPSDHVLTTTKNAAVTGVKFD